MEKSCIEQEEGSFLQQTGLTYKGKSSKVLNLEHSFVWCWNWDTSESRLEIPEKCWNVVLEKNGEDKFDWSCENEVLHTVKWEGKAYWIGQILRRKLPATTHYWRKEKEKERSDDKEEDVSIYSTSLRKR